MGRVLTLLYHRVNDLAYDKNLLAVTPEHFYEHISYLKKNYPIVRFEEDWNNLKNDAVCITFDDGYMDNFTKAQPILEELGVPATVFAATGTIDTSEEFWWDELERLLLYGQNKDETFALEDEIFSCEWPTATFTDREKLYDTLHWLMYDKITVEKRENWIRQLRKWSKAESEGRRENYAVNKKMLVDSSSVLTLGAHTVHHPSLRNLLRRDQEYEISKSIEDLEAWLGYKVNVFSYPFGGIHDFDETAVEICRQKGICKAAANIQGVWKPGCDVYRIPRNIVRDWEIEEYIQEIEAFWTMG